MRKLNLFLAGTLLFEGYMLFNESPAKAMNDELMDMEHPVAPSKKNPAVEKKDGELSSEDLFNRIRNLPKERLEKADGAKLAACVRDREDKVWVNQKGNRILLESRKGS